jgi:ribosomal protein S18 acetylase RimI-like enzyme
MAFAETGGAEILAWQTVAKGETVAGLAFVLIPGGVALTLLPGAAMEIRHLEQCELNALGIMALRKKRVHYLQALVEPEKTLRRGWVEAMGFARLTQLHYLERGVLHPWADAPDGHLMWEGYTPAAHRDFSQVIERSYDGSADCPELTGLRPIEDVIASHKAAGRFRPDLWQLIKVPDRGNRTPAGCVLLTEIVPSTVEIVYMGVVPSFRGRGLGEQLLRRALELSRAMGAQQITLAVDERNTAARRLYGRFAFARVAERTAFLLRIEKTGCA